MMRSRLVLLVAVLACGIILWIALSSRPQESQGELGRIEEEERREEGLEADRLGAAQRSEAAPLEAQPAAEPNADAAAAGKSTADPAAPATLRVLVVRGEKKEPVPDARVEIHRYGSDDLFNHLAETTDERGAVQFENLAPGRIYASIRRGERVGDEHVDLLPGETAERTLELEAGIRVSGIVVDERERPIADAEVVVAGWTGGEAPRLALTDAQGRFDLQDLSTHCHVGARAAGFAASPLQRCTATAGAALELVIRLDERAAELAGQVLDPLGQPVAGAVVQAGSTDQGNLTLADGTQAMGPREVRVKTDAEGRFRFAHLPVGEVPLAARARELAPWKETVTTRPGVDNYVAIQLQRGAVVHGTVRDEQGNGLEKVDIRCGDWDDLGFRRIKSGAGGTYRITGLAPGPHKLNAEDDERGRFEKQIELAVDQELEIDPVLSLGLLLRGRVLDDRGETAKRTMVEARAMDYQLAPSWHAFENTDKEGRFTLKSCPAGVPLHVTFRTEGVFPQLVLRDVMPGSDELVVRLPPEQWIWIQGKVTAPDGTVPANVNLSPYFTGGNGSPAETADPQTGAFKLGPYPPGEYQLTIHAAGYAPLKVPARTLEPHETWDVGTLHLSREQPARKDR